MTMTHRISISCAVKGCRRSVRLIRKAVRATLKEEQVDVPCQISIRVTNDEEIHGLNLAYRGVDRETDVLSFPMLRLKPGKFSVDETDLDPDTGRLYLGDMVISIDRAKAQAKEYGHSLSRETAYLSVHSILHLLGYDHDEDIEEKRRMRAREERVMERMGLRRKDDN
jgi:probable rRNA maturation factor